VDFESLLTKAVVIDLSLDLYKRNKIREQKFFIDYHILLNVVVTGLKPL